ncbi:MAG: hypothetical protein GY744_07560 [Gammaproteobacteria bacterium]|nr:hypothetical protein [Gammaproteobacteria bacterium]
MTKMTLSTYLMVSVIIILSGILWILFTQMDRSYYKPVYSADFQKEQNKIIQQVYQLQAKIVEAPEEVISVIPEAEPVQSQEMADIKPVVDQQVKPLQQSPPIAQKNQYNDVWSTFPSSDYESYYFLRNNPWSPDYKPGY